MELDGRVGMIIALLVVGALYERWRSSDPFDSLQEHEHLIKRFLITKGKGSNTDPVVESERPIMWIHVPHEINARWWPTFGSRNTRCTNQPYLQLCINTLVERCGSSWNICMIRDEDFPAIIPGWDIDLRRLSGDNQRTMRDVALCTMLELHGGMVVPPSFICTRDLISLHEEALKNTDFYSVEVPPIHGGGTTPGGALTNAPVPVAPSARFMGARRGSAALSEITLGLAMQFLVDQTAQPLFEATPAGRIMAGVKSGDIGLIAGHLVGSVNSDGKRIDLEALLGTGYVDLHPDTFGLLVPYEDILRRVSLKWFARMSPQQVLQSNTFVGRFLATCTPAHG